MQSLSSAHLKFSLNEIKEYCWPFAHIIYIRNRYFFCILLNNFMLHPFLIIILTYHLHRAKRFVKCSLLLFSSNKWSQWHSTSICLLGLMASERENNLCNNELKCPTCAMLFWIWQIKLLFLKTLLFIKKTRLKKFFYYKKK